MSFGGQSNAWEQRNMMDQYNQQMFMQTPQNHPQNNMAASFGHGGGGMYNNNSAGGGLVSYPQPRSGLNPVAFQGSGGVVGGGMPQQTHYNSIGTVTKINNDCGLVNNEVFFYRNVCKGPEPKLGDRVIFEAAYSSSGQFKWNATRIQLMQPIPQAIMNASKGGTYNSVAPPIDYRAQMQQRHLSPKRVSPVRLERDRRERERERERHHHSRDRDDDDHERKRRREDHDRSRDRVSGGARGGNSIALPPREREREREFRRERDLPERDREREQREREKERELREWEREKEREKEREREKPSREVETSRSVVPKGGRRVPRAIRRYMVQIPKSLLAYKNADIQEIRNRYTTLYIPSDFFHASIKWTDTFTPDNPFSLRRPSRFFIMHKLVEPPFEQKLEDLEPADSDYVYSAKVMLMGLPPISEFYRRCFDPINAELESNSVHPKHLINFLVGVRGRNEPMAIGGPWSPSLDGENPDTDPSVLIRTAIRTCKALTGIDLSNCTQWYRFVELYYHRTEYKNMEKGGPPRVETVVIYLPDVHSCMPTISEYEKLSALYKTSAENVISRRAAAFNKAAVAVSTKDDNNELAKTTEADGENTEGGANETATTEETEQNVVKEEEEAADAEDGDDDGVDECGDAEEEGDENNEENEENQNDDDEDEQMDTSGAAAEVVDTDNAHDDGDENEEPTPEPTHYTLLDLKTMKVQEIRDELLARDLSDKGVRNVVMARLGKALNTEKAEEMKAKNRERLQKIQQQQAAKRADQKEVKESKGKVKAKRRAAAKKNEKNDSKDDWADAIDFEMSDILILDEYDASKNPEDKEMTEKEKTQLLRRYSLRSSPRIIVHPNKLAKGGNFDCAMMSLSVLLDYHPEDTKERFFEVSLFAELFNEMLMRDFAFNIYKEIYVHNEKNNDSTEGNADGADLKTETGTADEANGDEKKEIKSEEPPTKIRKRRMSTADGLERERLVENGEKKAPPPKPQRRMSTVDGRESLVSAEDKKVVPAKPQRRMSTVDGREPDTTTATETSKKMVVAKPQLLLSFLYFDSTHCGYIFERDLEDLFSVLGLNLSRSQIKKVLGKLGNRQSVHYRKLTDKEETVESAPSIEDVEDLPAEELKDIALGNNKYEFVFGENNPSHNCAVAIDGDENNEAELINYNGAVIHLGKLMEQVKRTERNHSDLEKLYNDIMQQNLDLQREQTRSSSKIKDLMADVKSLSRKLTETNQDLYSLNRKYRDQNSTLSYIYTRVSPYFVREKDKEKEKEKDSKSESSHKDKDDKKKEEDKSKEKEKNSEKEKGKEKDGDKEKVKEKDGDKEKDKETEKDKMKDKDDRVHDKESDKEKSKPAKETEKNKEKSKEAEKEKAKSKETEKEKAKSKETEKETCEEKNVEEKEATPKQPVNQTKVEKEKIYAKEPETAKETIAKPQPQTPAAKATPAVKATPAKAAPPKATPTKATPAKATPAKPTPAKPTPAKAVPAKGTPAKANPAGKKPVAVSVKKATTENAQK